MDNDQAKQTCFRTLCRSGGLMGPVVLVTLGVLFMLNEFDVASFHRTWPILLIVIGLVKVLIGNRNTAGPVDVMAPPASTPLGSETQASPQNPEARQVDHG
jgi:hypothetical protein